MLVDEPLGRPRGLVVALDRRALAVSRHALVGQSDVDDVREVRRLPRDDEGLSELQPDDPSLDVHAVSLVGGYGAEIETTYATTSASSWPDTRPPGMMPPPWRTRSVTNAASSPVP